jgi:hypothetical protein
LRCEVPLKRTAKIMRFLPIGKQDLQKMPKNFSAPSQYLYSLSEISNPKHHGQQPT